MSKKPLANLKPETLVEVAGVAVTTYGISHFSGFGALIFVGAFLIWLVES